MAVNMVFSIFHLIYFPLLFWPSGELSSLRTHFRPFTEVMRKSRREVTQEVGEQPRIARISRMRQTTLAESLLLNRANTSAQAVLLRADLSIERDRDPWLYSQPASAERRSTAATAGRTA